MSVSTLTNGCFCCARDTRDVASGTCATPTSTGSMCSTEEDTRSSQEGVKEEAATMKTAHGGPVATCGPEPRTLQLAKFHVENGVFVAQEMRRANAHKTTTSRVSSVLRRWTTSRFTPMRIAFRSGPCGAAAWHADGCGKLGLCISASTQQSVIKSCSWCTMQRKPRTRISRVLSTLSTQTSQDATAS